MPGKSVFWKLHFNELYHLDLFGIWQNVSSDGDRDGNLTFLERRQRV